MGTPRSSLFRTGMSQDRRVIEAMSSPSDEFSSRTRSAVTHMERTYRHDSHLRTKHRGQCGQCGQCHRCLLPAGSRRSTQTFQLLSDPLLYLTIYKVLGNAIRPQLGNRAFLATAWFHCELTLNLVRRWRRWRSMRRWCKRSRHEFLQHPQTGPVRSSCARTRTGRRR